MKKIPALDLARRGCRRFVPVALSLVLLSAVAADEDPAPCVQTIPTGESVQAAIDAAEDGAVLCLAPGVYRENLVITHPVTLRGTGDTAADVEIKGASKYDPGVLVLNPDGSDDPFTVTVENLTLSNRYPMKRHGVEVEGTAGIILRDAVVVGSEAYGLVLRDEATAEIVSTSILETELGVSFGDSSRATLRDSVVRDSSVKISGSAVVSVNGCDLSGNDLSVSGSATLDVSDSTLDRCRDPRILANAQASFANCSFWRLVSAIHVLGSAHLRLEDCTLTECRGGNPNHCTGLELMESASAEVVRCIFADNEDTSIQLRGSATLNLRDSQILRSRELGLMTFCVDCAGLIWSASDVRYFAEAEVFVGWVTGSGNVIPEPGEPDANLLGDVCPESLRYLKD